jgi:glycosyltransferase involved in cell wall biosynthesis
VTVRPRVAFFADSFHEVNGVALTSRQFEAFARRRNYPFLSVHVGPRDLVSNEGNLTVLELARGPVSFAVERDMSFDVLMMWNRKRVAAALREFGPNLVHITGPSDIGLMGARLAHALKIPLVASWHTNLHEFGARRLEKLLGPLPKRRAAAAWSERRILDACIWFYRHARVLLAPNRELMDMLQQRTGRPVFLMRRGIDTNLFTPARRDRQDKAFTIGYCGRVTPEKNVRFLRDLEKAVQGAGFRDYRFLIVGDGSERGWLEQTLERAEFTGVLKGEALARAYANMDVFAFPSHTDTFGNVVQEALASGVPAVVTTGGGPKYLVKSGETGFVAADEAAFVRCVLELMRDPEMHEQMRRRAREVALSISWDSVFEDVYRAYESILPPPAIQVAS